MRRAVILALALLGVAVLPAAPVSLARFTAAGATAATLRTGSLAAPTALAGTGGATAKLTWTPSTSTAATGYQVLRSSTSGSGYTQVGTVTPVSAATTTDSPATGTWYYVLRTALASWTSGLSGQASVIIGPPLSTGYKGCVTTAAVTSGSGDNNGYESTPAKACAPDGSVATDASSGTNTVISCTNAGKDRHRFGGYVFALPGSVSAINGITLRADVGLNSTSGTSIVCVELSGDAGLTWTAPRQVSLTATQVTTYTVGGAADLWGRAAWSVSELAPTAFEVRLTDVSSSASRSFRLDYLGVQVTYTP
jgi:hypothetical protein